MSETQQILAGDVGGTKTVLCLYELKGQRLRELRKKVYPSGREGTFDELIRSFLKLGDAPTAACFGVAGPVHDQRCDATNLPWVIDAKRLGERCLIDKVRLLNDLEAAAYGMLHLQNKDFVDLNPHARTMVGHKAVIAAGTGLGEAILFFDGEHHHAMPTEGGHCDFAPQNAAEEALLGFLRERHPDHVSYERILAGDGFGTLYDFLAEMRFANPDPDIEQEMAQAADRNAVISRHGCEGKDPLCTEAMRMFCRIYGAEAGNLALKTLPKGGLFIGGGIGPKIRPALVNGEFLKAFLAKGRMRTAIEHIPIRLALNPEAPLLGAVHGAVHLLD
ncbi:MAG: glucokinase [Gammaproteobacteria bacterium]